MTDSLATGGRTPSLPSEKDAATDRIRPPAGADPKGALRLGPAMSYRFEATPNENAIKVTGPRPFVQGSKTVRSAEQAEGDLEEALFAVDGVVQVFFLNDFVTVNKRPDAEWDAILPKVEAALEQHQAA